MARKNPKIIQSALSKHRRVITCVIFEFFSLRMRYFDVWIETLTFNHKQHAHLYARMYILFNNPLTCCVNQFTKIAWGYTATWLCFSIHGTWIIQEQWVRCILFLVGDWANWTLTRNQSISSETTTCRFFWRWYLGRYSFYSFPLIWFTIFLFFKIVYWYCSPDTIFWILHNSAGSSYCWLTTFIELFLHMRLICIGFIVCAMV